MKCDLPPHTSPTPLAPPFSPAAVFLVDDDLSVLKSLSRLMRSAGIFAVTYSSPREFLDKYDPRAAGCIVLDVAMPALDGMQLQEELARKGSRMPIIFLTGHGDLPMGIRAMKRGAVDFLTKPVNDADLLRAVRIAMETDRANRQSRDEVEEIRERLATLTPRECQVLDGVIAGKLNKQIAADLRAAEKTVKVHRGRVMKKMKIQSVAELVRLVEKTGVGEERDGERRVIGGQ